MLFEPNPDVHWSVFVVASLNTTWCTRNASRSWRSANAAEATFRAEVRDAFGTVADEVHAALVPEQRWSGDALFYLALSAAARVGRDMYRGQAAIELAHWWIQFDALARAEHLRRAHGPHHVVIRARLDVTFEHSVRLSPLVDALRANWSLAYLQYFGAPWDGNFSHLVYNDCYHRKDPNPASSAAPLKDDPNSRLRGGTQGPLLRRLRA